MLIGSLEKRPDIEAALNASFERMLAKYREVQASCRNWPTVPNRAAIIGAARHS